MEQCSEDQCVLVGGLIGSLCYLGVNVFKHNSNKNDALVIVGGAILCFLFGSSVGSAVGSLVVGDKLHTISTLLCRGIILLVGTGFFIKRLYKRYTRSVVIFKL
jgi:hypothetical protein